MNSQSQMGDDFRKVLLTNLSETYKITCRPFRRELPSGEFVATTIASLAQFTQVVIGGSLFDARPGHEELLARELAELLCSSIMADLPRTLESVSQFRAALAGVPS